ncbi:MAG: hypothetical protein DCF16_06880 [Alphaproteobacteria bacterium]|nr:MAG: hypothetical protein DCF16_06880 [Alphaproteobacteria bacterium]
MKLRQPQRGGAKIIPRWRFAPDSAIKLVLIRDRTQEFDAALDTLRQRARRIGFAVVAHARLLRRPWNGLDILRRRGHGQHKQSERKSQPVHGRSPSATRT